MTRQSNTLVACAVLFLSTLIIGASAQNIAKSDMIEAQKTISDQLSAFIENDASRAYSHAAPSIKKSTLILNTSWQWWSAVMVPSTGLPLVILVAIG